MAQLSVNNKFHKKFLEHSRHLEEVGDSWVVAPHGAKLTKRSLWFPQFFFQDRAMALILYAALLSRSCTVWQVEHSHTRMLKSFTSAFLFPQT